MEKTTGFLKRAWADLTSDEEWWKPVAILTLVSLIPIVGQFFMLGYILDWGREGAWGMTRGLTHQVGDATKRLKWGFFSIVIMFCWIVPISIIIGIVAIIPLLGWAVAIVGSIAMIALSVIAQAACIRMAIYDRLGAGLQFTRTINMAKMDPEGLLRCFGITLLAAVPAMVFCIVCGVGSLPFFGSMAAIGMMDGTYNVAMTTGLLGTGAMAGAISTVAYVVLMFCNTLCEALAYRAFGYWTAQFQPAKWGGMEEPMPFEPGYVDRRATASSAAAAASSFVADAADAVSNAAAGFKPERNDEEPAGEQPEVIEVEAEVVSVEEPAELEPATEEPAETAKTCPNCGTPVENHHKFCVNCGQNLQE